MVPCSEKSAAVCPSPLSTHLVVRSPSRPTGPRAWIRAVLMPTSAPRDRKRISDYTDQMIMLGVGYAVNNKRH